MKRLFIWLFCLSLSVANENETIESLPNILFTYDKLKKENTVTTLQVDFNKAVQHLENEEYEQAIAILERTSDVLRIPSYLNLGIAYYKLNDIHKAQVYLKQIYNVKETMYANTYAFMSTCYYLYEITKEEHYLEELIQAARDNKSLKDNEKRMLADTFIILKQYKQALDILKTIKSGVEFKKALLYIKLQDYKRSEPLLQRAYKESLSEQRTDEILWFMIYRDLKANDLPKLHEHLNILDQRIERFSVNRYLQLSLSFSETKYTSEEYLDFVVNYDQNRQLDMMFYFAPFVFSDNEEIIYDSLKGFIFNSKQNVQSLEQMVQYNSEFIKVIKDDPIKRVYELRKLIQNRDVKSYVYYNLALSLAQIQDFNAAHEYFKIAYKLNPGNKLYAAMTLLSAKRIYKTVDEESYIKRNIGSPYGLYNYFGQSLYALFIDKKHQINTKTQSFKNTIFAASIELLNQQHAGKKITGEETLFQDHYKDPLVFLMHKVLRKNNESQFAYISRLQDTIALQINNNFLDTSLIITEFYVDILKALALFDKANFNIDNYYSPSYLRTKALELIHDGNSTAAIAILEYLQNRYSLKDKYTLYLIVAAYLQMGEYEEASLQISLIKALLNDSGSNFLNGVQLVQDLKLNSARQFFNHPYEDTLIDFKLIGFDAFLESL
jgi:tetratricopeptide (TPR) repeat protein